MRSSLPCVIMLLVWQPLGAASVSELFARTDPLVIAHRGSSAEAPENTLPAFELALAAGADLIELDYLHSADGVPMVIHDDTLDRTTDAVSRWQGREITVRSKSAAELAEVDAGVWFRPSFRGTRLPTLIEALETIQAGGLTLIERKGGDAGTLIRLLRGRDWLDSVVVQSFDWGFLREAHGLAPDLVLGALGPPSHFRGRELTQEEKALTPEFVDVIAPLGVRVIGWNSQVTADAISHAHQHGLKVWIYTINSVAEARRLVELGADGVITDNPGLIRAGLRANPDAPFAPGSAGGGTEQP